MLLFQMRLDVYGLLCEQQKLTESVSATDLQLVDYFLSTNFNNQERAFRQSVLAATKKVRSLSLFFLTCQLCLNSIIRINWIADWNVYKVFVGSGILLQAHPKSIPDPIPDPNLSEYDFHRVCIIFTLQNLVSFYNWT